MKNRISVSEVAELMNVSEQFIRIGLQKGITIEDDCWIGSNVIILDGVTIGKGSVIGAGTLVSKDVPAGSVVVDKREKMVRER